MTLPVGELPFYLQQYVVQQDYSLYTAIDHACWRYIMRVSKDYFSKHAHPSYLRGLEETGITIDRIPRISEMDEKLKKFGWRAIGITGFIPPEPFMEMLSLSVLPIASDMRKLENIDYTPSPDIVHEAAGHAPIIADKAYASYLHKFGEVATKVLFSKEDNAVYEAVLRLSEIKEDPASTSQEIDEAQKGVEDAYRKVKFVSEAQQLTRLGWWSTEYGLYKKGDDFLIYGAGLLSSVGESYNCLGPNVQRIPLTLDCIKTEYDITRPQPQLFYTDDFKKLEKTIDELAQTMAFKLGGKNALDKGLQAETVSTTVLDSGLQISGILSQYETSGEEISFLKYTGPVQLSYNGKQIEGHGPTWHKEGFSSPLGRPIGLLKPIHKCEPSDLEKISLVKGITSNIKFDSGFEVNGLFKGAVSIDGYILLLSFSQCRVSKGEKIYFDPSWGDFDLICGEQVLSVYGGAGDRATYLKETNSYFFKARPQKINLTDENKQLTSLYAEIRSFREQPQADKKNVYKRLTEINDLLKETYKEEWLLRLEMLELIENQDLAETSDQLAIDMIDKLRAMSETSERMNMLISRGMKLQKNYAF